MIARIQGIIQEIYDEGLIVNIAGVGFDVRVPAPTTYKVGDKADLYTYLHWNQEQGPTLFGFAHADQKAIFELAISCSGVGPKMGLSILELLTPAQFIAAVHAGDERALSQVSGIGPKRAEQMIVHLKHKVSKLVASGAFAQQNTAVADSVQLSQALQSLGYARPEIAGALKYVQERSSQEAMTFDLQLRSALTWLSKTR
ncbi:Holliday junction branch migration protein RuvA [Vermiphilus pyriformis]|jgi:Holliday junction DNA helicase RuvA|uniref:Holliday junction branch migration complex subunit RuvA n=1 Tax=candidate division TM6 bacterium JCVI TM6SC1 TaxID=1306947 RepID=A0A0D2JD97_9BACT|nr:hypothetical protein J120_04345 [candidate division TM6 bacterium JCVI TM6SC1]UNE34995.1 MAG: Holliday junction branch migration protein RuvA [Vermiphilus pyriformis]